MAEEILSDIRLTTPSTCRVIQQLRQVLPIQHPAYDPHRYQKDVKDIAMNLLSQDFEAL